MPLGLETIFGIGFLGAMIAIAVGLTWAGFNEELTAATDTDAEPAD